MVCVSPHPSSGTINEHNWWAPPPETWKKISQFSNSLVLVSSTGCFQKQWYPQIIHLFIGVFHDIFTIHFGGFQPPLFFGGYPHLVSPCYPFRSVFWDNSSGWSSNLRRSSVQSPKRCTTKSLGSLRTETTRHRGRPVVSEDEKIDFLLEICWV